MDELSTLMSSGSAVVAMAVSLFLLRQGQADRRLLAEEGQRTQARQVSAWTDWHDVGERAESGESRLPAVFVKNSSDAAVYDVFVDYRTAVDGALYRAGLGPVPPGETRVYEIDYDGSLDCAWEPSALFARVNFRDSTGRRWLRDALGRLRADPGAGHDGFSEQGGVILAGRSVTQVGGSTWDPQANGVGRPATGGGLFRAWSKSDSVGRSVHSRCLATRTRERGEEHGEEQRQAQ